MAMLSSSQGLYAQGSNPESGRLALVDKRISMEVSVAPNLIALSQSTRVLHHADE